MKKNDSNIVKSIGVGILVAALMVGSAITVGLVSYLKKGTTIEIAQGEPDGMTVFEVHARGLALTVIPLAQTDLGDGEIVTDASYTVTLTPDSVDAVDTYLWSATDNVNITHSSLNDGKSCIIKCNSAFGTPITVTVSSKVNADISAEITLDYVKAITSLTVTSPKIINFNSSGRDYSIEATPVYGVGTVMPDGFTITGGKLSHKFSMTGSYGLPEWGIAL